MPVIEELVERTVGRMRWLPHNKNPADSLTKFKGAHVEPLLRLLATGHLQLSPEAEELQARAKEKEALGYSRRLKVSSRAV